MRLFATLILLSLTCLCSGQQDPVFTAYRFNSLVYNPAYAGAKDHLAIGMVYRQQWWGLDGGPSTQTFTIHSPLVNERVGLGFHLTHDKIGPTHDFSGHAVYAYRIPIENAKLSIALQAGFLHRRTDWSKLNKEPGIWDEAFDDAPPSHWFPNFGLGLYYYSRYFFAGVSAPRLMEHDLRPNSATEDFSKLNRVYYFTVGGAIPLPDEQFILKPTFLFKNIGMFEAVFNDQTNLEAKAPSQLDAGLSALFQKTLWIGASLRTALSSGGKDFPLADSIDFWTAVYLQNGLRIGTAFDFTLSKLRKPANGTFELFVGFEFDFKTKGIVSPRFF